MPATYCQAMNGTEAWRSEHGVTVPSSFECRRLYTDSTRADYFDRHGLPTDVAIPGEVVTLADAARLASVYANDIRTGGRSPVQHVITGLLIVCARDVLARAAQAQAMRVAA